jgi:hypothetical protein
MKFKVKEPPGTVSRSHTTHMGVRKLFFPGRAKAPLVPPPLRTPMATPIYNNFLPKFRNFYDLAFLRRFLIVAEEPSKNGRPADIFEKATSFYVYKIFIFKCKMVNLFGANIIGLTWLLR